MTKKIKQMEMDSLKNTFKDVRDMVFLSVSGANATADNQLRLKLRKKKIHMQWVKNSLASRVLSELGLAAGKKEDYWKGSTLISWGMNSLGELSREIETDLLKNPIFKDKVKIKGAIADGQEVSFQLALKMPTKAEALARVITLALSPASRLVGQILSPAGRIAGQIKTLSEKVPEAAPPPPA